VTSLLLSRQDSEMAFDASADNETVEIRSLQYKTDKYLYCVGCTALGSTWNEIWGGFWAKCSRFLSMHNKNRPNDAVVPARLPFCIIVTIMRVYGTFCRPTSRHRYHCLSSSDISKLSFSQTFTCDIVIKCLTSVKCSRSFFNCTALKKYSFNNNNNNNNNNHRTSEIEWALAMNNMNKNSPLASNYHLEF